MAHESRCVAVEQPGVALEGEVVPEPFRLFMSVHVTTNPGEQRRVIERGPLRLVQAEALAKIERDHAFAHHVIHRLTHAEVGAQRQHGDHLCQANARAFDSCCHRPSLTAAATAGGPRNGAAGGRSYRETVALARSRRPPRSSAATRNVVRPAPEGSTPFPERFNATGTNRFPLLISSSTRRGLRR